MHFRHPLIYPDNILKKKEKVKFLFRVAKCLKLDGLDCFTAFYTENQYIIYFK